jgi:fructokinase
MVSAVGEDDLGQQALTALSQRGVKIGAMQVRPEQTGQVLVQVDAHGHPTYTFNVDTAWDNLAWTDDLEQLAQTCHAVCFGTLGQRSAPALRTIRQFVQSTPTSCLRVLDINLRPPYWTPAVVLESLPLGNVFKCNDAELPVIADLLGLVGTETELLQQLQQRYQWNVAALTKGEQGALLLDSAGLCCEVPGIAAQVVDTVGAGDAFTAALVLGLLWQLPLQEIGKWACQVAAHVCTQPGATPHIPETYGEPLRT